MNINTKYCEKCVHFMSDTLSCSAFPNRIPSELLSGKIKHKSRFPDQIGNDVFENEIDFLKSGGIDVSDLERWDDVIID